MIQFQENAWTEDWIEGQKVKPYFIEPFRLPPGIQNKYEKLIRF